MCTCFHACLSQATSTLYLGLLRLTASEIKPDGGDMSTSMFIVQKQYILFHKPYFHGFSKFEYVGLDRVA